MFETLGITQAEFQTFLLILARIAAILVAMPFFSNPSISGVYRFTLSLFLAFMTVNLIPPPQILPVPFLELLFYGAVEMVTGLIIGLVAQFVFECLQLAGFLTGRMIGLGMVTLIDPNREEESQALSQLMTFVALLLLFTFNGHHFFLEVLFDSFFRIPLTEVSFSEPFLRLVMNMFTQIFIIGLKIGAPVFGILFLQRIVLALFAKMTPEIQIMIVAFPLTIMVGFFLLSYYWPYFSFGFIKYFGQYGEQLGGVLKLLGE